MRWPMLPFGISHYSVALHASIIYGIPDFSACAQTRWELYSHASRGHSPCAYILLCCHLLGCWQIFGWSSIWLRWIVRFTTVTTRKERWKSYVSMEDVSKWHWCPEGNRYRSQCLPTWISLLLCTGFWRAALLAGGHDSSIVILKSSGKIFAALVTVNLNVFCAYLFGSA